MKNAILTIFLTLVAFATCARGAELLVPSQYPTIQSAIDASWDGDIILVAPGTYTGPGNYDIDFRGKAVTVRSENGPNNCIIDCNSTTTESHRGFFFHTGEDANSVVAGFNIKNGYYSYYGAGISCQGGRGGRVSPSIIDCLITADSAVKNRGIYCYDSSPTITNCTITGNSDGGILFEESDPKITNCTISNNNQGGIYCDKSISTITDYIISNNNGSGISCMNSSIAAITDCTVITGCTITGNSAERGGGIYCQGGNTIIADCIISDNKSSGRGGEGGGMSITEGLCLIYNSIISGNSATSYGGGMYNIYGSPMLTNCIVWGNEAPNGPDIYGSTSVLYSDVKGGWPGTGNIDADPCFVAPDINDYHLLSTSPCINAGDPNYVPEPNETDLDGLPRIIGGRIDMGAYEFNHQPVAVAGPNQTVYAWLDGLADVALVGSASYDDDNDLLDFYWSWTIDGNTYEANGINPTIKMPVGIHTIELIVDDRIDLSEPDYCTITIINAIRGKLILSPNVLQTKNRGKWVIATLYLPPVIGEKVNTTVPLRLYPSGIEAKYQYFSKYRRFGCAPTIAIAFFDKQQVIDALGPGRFEVDVVGQFLSGRFLFGSDSIKITTPKPPPNPWHW
jgi:parallel beta-helix repeat protein